VGDAHEEPAKNASARTRDAAESRGAQVPGAAHGSQHDLLVWLQRSAGNAAATAWVQRQNRPHRSPPPTGDISGIDQWMLRRLRQRLEILRRYQRIAAQRLAGSPREPRPYDDDSPGAVGA